MASKKPIKQTTVKAVKSTTGKTAAAKPAKPLATIGRAVKKAVAAITGKPKQAEKKTPKTATTQPAKKITNKANPVKQKIAVITKKVVQKAPIIKVETPKKSATKPEKPAQPKAKRAPKTSEIDKIMASNDVDMSMFAPPRPLEAKSDQAISDDEMATLREMEATQEAIDRVRQLAKITPPEDFDGENCVACGLEIENRRLDLGYYTCIDCERKKELTAKLFRR